MYGVMNRNDLFVVDNTPFRSRVVSLLATTDGCAPTRTACANCTCGRAEEEVRFDVCVVACLSINALSQAKGRAAAKSKLTLAMLENPGESSSCGNVSTNAKQTQRDDNITTLCLVFTR